MSGSRRPLPARSSVRSTARAFPVLGPVGMALISVALLAGCTPSKATGVSPSTSTPSSSSAVAPLRSTPFAIECNSLAPAATMAAAYPGYALSTATSKPFGDASLIADAKGQVCTWTSAAGDAITLAVGQYDQKSLTAVKNGLVTSSNSVPTYGVEGYFTVHGKTGVAEAFTDPYWIVATSTTFVEPGSAQALVSQAVAALAAAG